MKIDRLIGILSILLQRDKITASELAEKFEVSRRTIVRDIEDISKAGIPITASQGRNGGISIMDGFKLDRTLLSTEDMKAILTGLQGLDSVSESSRYRRLMEKLSAENAVKAIGNGETILDSEASETITYVIKAADGDNSGGDASGGTDGKKGCGCKNASVTLGGIGAFGLVLLAAGLIAKKRRV